MKPAPYRSANAFPSSVVTARAPALSILLPTYPQHQYSAPPTTYAQRFSGTHQIQHDPGLRKFRTLPKPVIHTQEALTVTDVIDEDAPLRVPVVAAREGSKAFLSSRIEEQETVRLPADGELLHAEIHADRRRCRIHVEDVVDVAQQQCGLAAIRRADQEKLDSRLFARWCHVFCGCLSV